jgi:hypothetical protein
MKKSIKIRKGQRHFGHITLPYTEKARNLLFKKKIDKRYSVYHFGELVDTVYLSKGLVESLESIGYNVIPVDKEMYQGHSKIGDYDVAISKSPVFSPKEIVVLISAETIEKIREASDYISEYIKSNCGVVNIRHDIWIDNCEV